MYLQPEQVSAWAEVALANAVREFPHAELVVLEGPGETVLPGRLSHPSFYGAFDWHSAVEMHWVMARLLARRPAGAPLERLAAHLDDHLSREKLAVEAANLPPGECPYGYAWLLKLAAELEEVRHERAPRWRAALSPLAAAAADRLTAWATTSELPVRTGLHSNSAFSSSLALEYARRHDAGLLGAIEEAAGRWYGADRDCPLSYEPSGTDFLSPCLSEAELMGRLLGREEFSRWLASFLPSGKVGLPANVASPVMPGEQAVGQLGHLHGLNLSRAFALGRIAARLGEADERYELFSRAAEANAASSLRLVVGSDYSIEHWLVSFALLYVSEVPARD